MEIIKPFKSNKVISDSLSTRVDTLYGKLNIDFKVLDVMRIRSLNDAKFIFPYGQKIIDKNEGITPKHGYLSIQLDKQADNYWDRQHFEIAFLLPDINEKYFAPDSSNNYKFKEISSEGELNKSELKSINLYLPKRGLLAIPYDEKLLKGLGITIEKISQERWEKYPTYLLEQHREIQASLYTEQKNNRKRIPQVSPIGPGLRRINY